MALIYPRRGLKCCRHPKMPKLSKIKVFCHFHISPQYHLPELRGRQSAQSSQSSWSESLRGRFRSNWHPAIAGNFDMIQSILLLFNCLWLRILFATQVAENFAWFWIPVPLERDQKIRQIICLSVISVNSSDHRERARKNYTDKLWTLNFEPPNGN